MQFKSFVSGSHLSRITLAAIMAITFTGVAGAQEGRTGKVQQGLVGGGIVTPEAQERNGLLTLDTGCSASLLRNNWVITAAHCVDNPNPMIPGQFILNPENSVTLTANWNAVQQRQSVRIITFRPLDVAIIRVASPFSVGGSTADYNREAFREGELMSLSIIALGRGVNRFAEGSGSSAIPSQTDGMFRVGVFNISSVADNKYRFPSTAGQSMSGGDSGGPSYATVGDRLLLVGVHTGCQQECAGGKTCGPWPGPGPVPADYSNWQWVTATPSCSDTSIGSIWDEIDRYLGAFVPTPRPVMALGRVKTGAPTGPPISICDSARRARARNSPAAPGLEAQCRAAGAAGEIPPKALGRVKLPSTLDPPISICDSALGARARNSPAAPGLEAQCRAYLAAKGAAIAEADETVAAARSVETDVLYRQGFDIATGIFGDPALGAQGKTATGPGSLGNRGRGALSAAGQRGFDASVKLHLSRNYKPTSVQAAPTIAAATNPVMIPNGQASGATTITWKAGPDYTYCEIYLSIDNGEWSEFARGRDGSKQTTIKLGSSHTFRMMVYEGQAGTPKIITTLTVTGAPG